MYVASNKNPLEKEQPVHRRAVLEQKKENWAKDTPMSSVGNRKIKGNLPLRVSICNREMTE